MDKVDSRYEFKFDKFKFESDEDWWAWLRSIARSVKGSDEFLNLIELELKNIGRGKVDLYGDNPRFESVRRDCLTQPSIQEITHTHL